MASSCPAVTLSMTGTLHDEPFPPSQAGASGTFFLALTDRTLTYRISTRALSIPDFDLSTAGFHLQSGTENIPLPIADHQVIGLSGCSLEFKAYSPFTSQRPGFTPVLFPLGIAEPGLCDAFFQLSSLSGSIELSESDLPLFDRPDFTVSLNSLGLVGRTDPEFNAIPEPTTFTFCSLALVTVFRRKKSLLK